MRPDTSPPGWEDKAGRRLDDWWKLSRREQLLYWRIHCGETMLIAWESMTAADRARFDACKERLQHLHELAAARSIDSIVRHVMDDWLRRTEPGVGEQLDLGGTQGKGYPEKTP